MNLRKASVKPAEDQYTWQNRQTKALLAFSEDHMDKKSRIKSFGLHKLKQKKQSIYPPRLRDVIPFIKHGGGSIMFFFFQQAKI